MRIVVTGVSRGLGRALVERFTNEGHTVLGCARSGLAIAEFQKRFGHPHQFAAVDVRDDRAVAAWAASVIAGGPPDLLINNAGQMNQCAPLWEVSEEEFAKVIDVNIKGVANVLRHFLPAMVACNHGVIVNISSGWGRSVAAEVAPYCASKWAIEGLTRALAEELPKGMAAVPLNPGIINTEMLRSCWGDAATSYPDATDWAERAVPLLLELGPKDNGLPLSVSRKKVF